MKELIAVTGAGGFIGTHILTELQQQGYPVRAFVREKPTNPIADITYIAGDLKEARTLDQQLDGVSVVINLATRQKGTERELIEDNTAIAANLVTEMRRVSSVEHFIHVSSVAVYGESQGNPFKEGDRTEPTTGYGISKLLQEELFRYWQRTQDKKLTILRPSNIYGPGNTEGIISKFIGDIEKDNKVTIYGDGQQRRQFLYVSDFVDLVIKALNARKSGTYNVAGLKSYSLSEIAELCTVLYGREIEVQKLPADNAKSVNLDCISTACRETFSWEDKVTIDRGLAFVRDWIKR